MVNRIQQSTLNQAFQEVTTAPQTRKNSNPNTKKTKHTNTYTKHYRENAIRQELKKKRTKSTRTSKAKTSNYQHSSSSFHLPQRMERERIIGFVQLVFSLSFLVSHNVPSLTNFLCFLTVARFLFLLELVSIVLVLVTDLWSVDFGFIMFLLVTFFNSDDC